MYLIFIVLQALGPFAGLLLNKPSRVQRKDGILVQLQVTNGVWFELRTTSKLFISRKFLSIIPFICQAVYTEAVMFSYEGLWFSVRARALGSFLSGIIALTVGNLLGAFLDNKSIYLKTRTRSALFFVVGWQGMCWMWASVVTTEFHQTNPVYDWSDPGFGKAFSLFLFCVAGFQLNYMYLYVGVECWLGCRFSWLAIWLMIMKKLFASGLLRGTESAAKTVSVRFPFSVMICLAFFTC